MTSEIKFVCPRELLPLIFLGVVVEKKRDIFSVTMRIGCDGREYEKSAVGIFDLPFAFNNVFRQVLAEIFSGRYKERLKDVFVKEAMIFSTRNNNSHVIEKGFRSVVNFSIRGVIWISDSDSPDPFEAIYHSLLKGYSFSPSE